MCRTKKAQKRPRPYSSRRQNFVYGTQSIWKIDVIVLFFHEQYGSYMKRNTGYFMVCSMAAPGTLLWFKNIWRSPAKKGPTSYFEPNYHLQYLSYPYQTWHVHSKSTVQLRSESDLCRTLIFKVRTRPVNRDITRKMAIWGYFKLMLNLTVTWCCDISLPILTCTYNVYSATDILKRPSSNFNFWSPNMSCKSGYSWKSHNLGLL